MGVEHKRELHPLFETLGLIYVMKDFALVKADLLKSLEKMEIDGENFYKKNLSYLEGYVSEFEKRYVSCPGEEFFFGGNEEFFLFLCAMVMEYPQLEEKLGELTDEEILKLAEAFLAEEGDHIPAGLDTVEKRVEMIQSTEYSEDTKWKLLMLMNEPLEKFGALFEIYRKNLPAFEYTKEVNKGGLEPLFADAASEIPPVMEKLIAGLAKEEITVWLTAVFPLIGWLSSKEAFQGILLNKLYLYKRSREEAREILPGMLKILGDKSKFEILCSLKERGKYNLEIAEELKLTPATASHHMGILLCNHFVTVEKRDGKVYYQFNQEAFGEMIRLLEEIFL